MNEVINNWLKTYLIGAMEKTAANDAGKGWRTALRTELGKRMDNNGNPIYVFDPTLEEQNKVDYHPLVFHQKVEGWIASGNNDKVKEGADLIWRGKTYLRKSEDTGKAELVHTMGDIDYVENSDFLICKIEKGDIPCGTYFESGYGYKLHIPIYVIQTMARIEYSQSLVSWVFGSGGAFIANQSQLLEFLDKKYNLKVKE